MKHIFEKILKPRRRIEGNGGYHWLRGVTASLLILLAGCAGLPAQSGRVSSTAIPVATDTELGAAVLQAFATASIYASEPELVPASFRSAASAHSGFLPIPQPSVALDARLTLIRRAQSSLDLQYYLVGDDIIGRLLLRELRDAAGRGVRVRLLIDDFYTAGMDSLLLGLASYPNIEVRLFNPFMTARSSMAGRLLSMAFDFDRLNHRMHNKLFLADGAMAIVGGRNMADGYYLPPDMFIDFDALAVGPVVPQLQSIFDRYWNSQPAYDLAAVASSSQAAQDHREYFEQAVSGLSAMPKSAAQADIFGVPLLSVDLRASLQNLIWAEADVMSDRPDKLSLRKTPDELADTVLHRSLDIFSEARSELILFSPYFVPGALGMAGLKVARDHNIKVRVVTNSMASTDEPLASLAYERYRVPMLKLGVELYELQPRMDQADDRGRPGASRARWHAKIAFVDRKTVVMGSMNLDQRSATTNTELVLTIQSPEFAHRILSYLNATRDEDVKQVYQIKLKPDGSSLQWHALQGEGRAQIHDSEPDKDYLLRLQLLLLSPFVPEGLL